MLYKMMARGPQVTWQDLQGLAAMLPAPLPDAYVAFLLQTNGGEPVPDYFPIEGLPNNRFGHARRLFSLRASLECYDLGHRLQLAPEALEAGYLPIGCDDSGDELWLRLADGAVFFWNCYDDAETPLEERLFPVAADFGTFLHVLCDSPDVTE